MGLRGAAPIAGAVPAAVRAALPAGPLFFSLPLWLYSAFFLSALFKFVLLSVLSPFPCVTLSHSAFFRTVLLCFPAHRCAFSFVLLLYFVSFYCTVNFALFSLFYRILLHLFLTFFTFLYSILIYFYLFCCILLYFSLFHSILLHFTLFYFTSPFFYCILLYFSFNFLNFPLFPFVFDFIFLHSLFSSLFSYIVFLCCFVLHHLTLVYLTLFCHTLPYFALFCLILPYFPALFPCMFPNPLPLPLSMHGTSPPPPSLHPIWLQAEGQGHRVGPTWDWDPPDPPHLSPTQDKAPHNPGGANWGFCLWGGVI